MSCTGCSNDTGTGTGASTGKAGNAFDAAFGRFWPAGLPGPRLLPWLGAAVSRDDARAWALAIGADRDPGVLAGDEQAMLHLIGLAMAGGGVYAEERKGRKKKGGSPDSPTGWRPCGMDCDGVWVEVWCPPGTDCFFDRVNCTISCQPSFGSTVGMPEDADSLEGR